MTVDGWAVLILSVTSALLSFSAVLNGLTIRRILRRLDALERRP